MEQLLRKTKRLQQAEQAQLRKETKYKTVLESPEYAKFLENRNRLNLPDLPIESLYKNFLLSQQRKRYILKKQDLKIYDGMYSEYVTVASNYVFGSTTVPITQALLYSHSAGVSISALPPAIKEATILATTAMLKVRGDSSLTMSVGTMPNSSGTPNLEQNIGNDMAMAMDLLKPYRRIR